jgi:hypothetical protein
MIDSSFIHRVTVTRGETWLSDDNSVSRNLGKNIGNSWENTRFKWMSYPMI